MNYNDLLINLTSSLSNNGIISNLSITFKYNSVLKSSILISSYIYLIYIFNNLLLYNIKSSFFNSV